MPNNSITIPARTLYAMVGLATILAVLVVACAAPRQTTSDAAWHSPHVAPHILFPPRKPAKPDYLPCENWTLENGLQVFATYEGRYPLVMAHLFCDVGTLTPEEAGVPYFLPTMYEGGSLTCTPRDIQQHFATTSASESQDGSRFVRLSGGRLLFGAATTSDGLERTLAIAAELVQRPLLAEEQMVEARARAQAALAELGKDPRRLLVNELLLRGAFAAGVHASAQVDAQGIQAIGYEQVKRFAQTHIRPERSVIVVHGRYDRERLRAHIAAEFGPWRCADGRRAGPEASPPQGSIQEPEALSLPRVALIDQGAAAQDKLLLALVWRGPERMSSDYAFARYLQFLLEGNTGTLSYYRQHAPIADRRFGEATVQSELLEYGVQTVHLLYTSVTVGQLSERMQQLEAALATLHERTAVPVSEEEWDRGRYTILREERTGGVRSLYASLGDIVMRAADRALCGLEPLGKDRVWDAVWNATPAQGHAYMQRTLAATPRHWVILGDASKALEALDAHETSVTVLKPFGRR